MVEMPRFELGSGLTVRWDLSQAYSSFLTEEIECFDIRGKQNTQKNLVSELFYRGSDL